MAWVDTGVTGQVGYWLRARSGAGRGRAKWALRASYSKCVPAPRDSPRFSTLLFWLSPPPPRVSLTARGPDLPVREELSLPERIKDGLGGSHRGRVGRGGSGRSRPGRVGRSGPRWAAVGRRQRQRKPHLPVGPARAEVPVGTATTPQAMPGGAGLRPRTFPRDARSHAPPFRQSAAANRAGRFSLPASAGHSR